MSWYEELETRAATRGDARNLGHAISIGFAQIDANAVVDQAFTLCLGESPIESSFERETRLDLRLIDDARHASERGGIVPDANVSSYTEVLRSRAHVHMSVNGAG